MICPHCGREQQRYLMSRSASENVLSAGTIAWTVVLVLLAVVIGAHA